VQSVADEYRETFARCLLGVIRRVSFLIVLDVCLVWLGEVGSFAREKDPRTSGKGCRTDSATSEALIGGVPQS